MDEGELVHFGARVSAEEQCAIRLAIIEVEKKRTFPQVPGMLGAPWLVIKERLPSGGRMFMISRLGVGRTVTAPTAKALAQEIQAEFG